jgi:hypothetical protein
MKHFVICRDESGSYVLATRRQFDTRLEALVYESGIAPSREPIVVEGEFPTPSPVNAELLEALRALTDWAREHTSPRDANSPHDLLVRAIAVIDEAEAKPKPDLATLINDPLKPTWTFRFEVTVNADSEAEAIRLGKIDCALENGIVTAIRQ